MQNIQDFSEAKKRETLCNLLRKDDVVLMYGGELPSGVVTPVLICGSVISGGDDETFTFESSNPRVEEEKEMTLKIKEVFAFEVPKPSKKG